MQKENNTFGSLNAKPRSKKLNTTVDLTAMVSVSFLLIVFFMVNRELSKPRSMNIGLPNYDSNCGPPVIICGQDSRRVITLLLDENNKIVSYKGNLDYLVELPKIVNYGKKGIRKELIDSNRKILAIMGDSKRGSIVIIKPSKKSTYGNLVSILDEINIANIDTYAIVNDYTPDEMKLLACN